MQPRRISRSGRVGAVLMHMVAMVVFVVAAGMPAAGAAWAQSVAQWEVYEESISNSTYSGNPFDLVAKVTFTHTASGATRTTEMFYAGNDVWRWRFNGEKQGQWTYITKADGGGGTTNDPQLHGHSGSINVTANSNPKIKGFLTHEGNKFAVMTGADGTGRDAYLFNVFHDPTTIPFWIGDWSTNLQTVHTQANAYYDLAQDYGSEVVFLIIRNSWFDFPSQGWDEHSSENPDLTTFAVLEEIISTVHSRGGRTHLWLWGDNEAHRRWTPVGVGGINGTPDRRLQRYIAARLGPLAGWTAGYGFDLTEWVTPTQLRSWASYMHDHFAWQHMLSARGTKLTGSSPNINGYSSNASSVNDELNTDADHGPFSLSEIAIDVSSDAARPAFYEERHFYARSGYISQSMQGARRFLWWCAMTGGAGGWMGLGDNGPDYPRPGQLRTYYQFWLAHNRFGLDYIRDDSITNGHALRTPANDKFVFYREGASSIDIDLSAASGSVTAVAVRTDASYSEQPISLSTIDQTWNAPQSGDRAVYVTTSAGAVPDAPSGLSASAVSSTGST